MERRIIGFFLALSFLALTLDGTLCEGAPGKKGKREQHSFQMTFGGDFTLLLEGPWVISSVVGGTGNIGPSTPGDGIPLVVDGAAPRIAEIGDATCPCPGDPSCDTCTVRLRDGVVTKAVDFTYRNEEISWNDGTFTNVTFIFKFSVEDVTDSTLYTYSVRAWAEVSPLNWDPKDPAFCVDGIDFANVNITQLSPGVSKRARKQAGCDRGETCEAHRPDFPFQPGDFVSAIWRDGATCP